MRNNLSLVRGGVDDGSKKENSLRFQWDDKIIIMSTCNGSS